MTSGSRIRFSLLLFLVIAGICAAQVPFPAKQAVSQIIDPVQLDEDTTRLYLASYVSVSPDSITFSKGIKSDWNRKAKTILVKALPELKPLAEMKLWFAGSAYSVILKKAINTDKDDPGRPVINTSKLGRGSFTIAANYSRSPFSMACYWQNFKLGKGYIKRAGEEMLVIIPEEAKKIKRTYIRVFANDDESRSNDILIPLEYGEVVNDPKEIEEFHNRTYIDSIRSHLYYLHDGNDVLLLNTSSTEKFAEGLRRAMRNYGSNKTLSRLSTHSPSGFYFPSYHAKSIIWNFNSSDSDRIEAEILLAVFTAIPGIGPDSSYADLFKSSPGMYSNILKLVKLHSDYLALQYGETDIAAKGNLMMIKRTYFSQTVLFVFNKTKGKQAIETGLDLSSAKAVFGHTATGGKVELPPMSFEVFIK